MNRRLIIYSILVSLALTLLSIFFFDQPIAAFVQRAGGRSSAILLQGTSFLEVISGFHIRIIGSRSYSPGLEIDPLSSMDAVVYRQHPMHNASHSRNTEGSIRETAPVRGDSSGRLGLEIL